MPQIEATGPNAEQIRYWNERAGPLWVALHERLDEQLSALGLAAMERAALRPGERVLDIGCGCGHTTLQLAERVGPGGAVAGLDLSGAMLERARERARDAQVDHASFEHADAQTRDFPPDAADLVFSRFGVMFFADPVAAFANLRGALRPGGRLAFVCWQELRSNPWMLVPLLAVAKEVPLPEPPPAGTPGPFSFADPERVRGILEGAGFVDVHLEPLEGQLLLGGREPIERVAEFVTQMGPAGRALAEADDAVRTRAAQRAREALEPFATDAGVQMDYAAWIATGRRPDAPKV